MTLLRLMIDENNSSTVAAVVATEGDTKDEDEKLRQELEKMAMSAYEDVLDALVYVPEEGEVDSGNDVV